MVETFSLKKNRDFVRVYNKGKSKVNPVLVLYVLENGENYNRIGITVSRKVGKSVVRNRVKRLIKEAYRKHKHQIKSGYDLVFVSRIQARNSDYYTVDKWMDDLLRRHNLYKKEGST